MRAYLKTSAGGNPKFITGMGKRVHYITKLSKLVTKNANRSRKKAARQEVKKNLKLGNL
jgi:hypothetical protein